ncbi:MAG: hypothetical protein NVS9B10_08580 [Nevskia sp.]
MTQASSSALSPPASEGRVRHAQLGDAPAILALENHFPTDRMSLRSVRRFLSRPNSHVWIAELDGAVVGALIWLSRQGSRAARIYSVVVAPEARGRRYAQRLLAAMEGEARADGRATATLEVRQDNAAARALYRKLGYVEAASLPDFYEDGGNGLKLVKDLRQALP